MLTRIENWLFELLATRRRARAAAIAAAHVAWMQAKADDREARCTCGMGRAPADEHERRWGIERCPVYLPF